MFISNLNITATGHFK